MAEIVYGSALSFEIKVNLKNKVDALVQQGKRVPCLAVVLVGDNPASLSYVKGKEKACAEVGFLAVQTHLSAECTQEELHEVLRGYNEDPSVDGILLQLPLPKGLDERAAIATIVPEKDVDGLHPLNVGRLYLDEPCFVPCTPLGVMEILNKMHCPVDGCRALVIGRSHLVGSPVARLLQNKGATVTIAHSHTKNLKELCRSMDIVIAAIGKPRFLDHTYFKEDAYVVDVGINRDENGKLCGDVDFADVEKCVAAITPVPKGVGPMTIAMLLENTMRAYEVREA